MRSLALVLLLGAAPAFAADAPCRASADVQKVLSAIEDGSDDGRSPIAESKRRLETLLPLLAAHPTDPFVLRGIFAAKVELVGDLDGFRAVLQKARAAGLDEAEALVFDGKLAGADEKAAESAYRAAIAKSQHNANANRALGKLYLALDDPKQARAPLLAAQAACPDEAWSYSELARLHDPALSAQLAKTLRPRLEASKDEQALASYPALWKLSFGAASTPAAQNAVRAKVKADLVHLRALGGDRPTLALLDIIQEGYPLVGDKEGKRWVTDTRARLYPDSRQAKNDVVEAWERDEMAAQRSAADRKALQPKRLANARAWVKRWPNALFGWSTLLQALLREHGVSPADVELVTSTLLRLDTASLTEVASAYDRWSLHVDRIPALVKRGAQLDAMQSARQARTPMKKRPGVFDVMEVMSAENVADLLVRTEQKLGHPTEARRALTDFEKLADKPLAAGADEDAKAMYDWAQVSLADLRGHVALAEGKKADALAYFQLSRSLETPPSEKAAPPEPSDPLDHDTAKDAESTFLALGGSKAGYALLPKSKPAASKSDEGSWKPVDRALTDFTLTDLAGKTWRSRDLRGKTVLVTLWATWCGPCKLELPDIKVLAARLAGRKDVVQLSFNVDEESGLVAPFVSENEMKLPVLLAASVSKSANPSGGIPYSFIVDKKGRVRAESSGFNPDAAGNVFIEQTLAQLERVK